MIVPEEEQNSIADALTKIFKAAIGAYLDGDRSAQQQTSFQHILEAQSTIEAVLHITYPKVLTDEQEAELQRIPRDADIEQTIARGAESAQSSRLSEKRSPFCQRRKTIQEERR